MSLTNELAESAEAALLGCLRIDQPGVTKVLREFGFSPEHLSRHLQPIAAYMLTQGDAGREFNLVGLVQNLKLAGTINGFANSDQLADLLYRPGVILEGLGEYIRPLMRRKAVNDAQRAANELAERLADPRADIAGAALEASQRLAAVARPQQETFTKRLRLSQFDWHREVARPDPVFMLGDATIATAGNLMGLSAQAKAGKSAFVGAMLAAAIGGEGDTLGVRAANHARRAVLHFDCEQSAYHHDAMIRRALKRIACEQPPSWLWSMWLTGWKLSDRKLAIRICMEEARKQFGGVHSAVIDGLADICADPNDSGEAFGLIDELHQMAIEFDTVICCVIHENPGSEIGKTRGHLGSQLERKAETNLRMAKDDEGITVVYTERSREAHIPKSKGVCFGWSDDAGMHVTSAGQNEEKQGLKREKLAVLADELFSDSAGLGMAWEPLHQAIETKEGCSRATARRRFEDMLSAGIIRKKGGDYWKN
jgi:hypothetical protein